MYRICKIASLASRTFRANAVLYPPKSVGWHRIIAAHRFYSKGKGDCGKVKKCDTPRKDGPAPCKPVQTLPCKAPCPSDGKKYPTLQECAKPNLMSECPKPDCAWAEEDECNKGNNKKKLLIGLLIAAATLGALYYFLTGNKEEKKLKPSKNIKRPKVIKKNPSDSRQIPKDVAYLLIGGGTAAFSAFRAIKSADPTAKVLVITQEENYPYMRPPLSKELWFNEDPESLKKLDFKQWNGSQRSLFYEPDDFYVKCKDLDASANGGVAVARGWTVARLDVVNKKAYLEDDYEISYQKCLIATGALPRNLDVFEDAAANVLDKITLYRNIFDFEELNEIFSNAKGIAIVGGGFLGSELACSLGRKAKGRDMKIYQIFKEKGNMGKILPEYLSLWTSDRVKAEGVQVMPTTNVLSVKSAGIKGVELGLSSGKKIVVDQVIVSVGAEPNTELAALSDLEVDPELGGFIVNTELQARSHLFVAGDSACFYDPRLGRRRVEHHDHAVVSGRLAGENMTGSAKPYLHQSMFWSDLGPDVGYEAIGIVDSSYPTVGVFAKAGDKDNPKAVVTATNEGIRSKTEGDVSSEECKKVLNEEEMKAITDSEKGSRPANSEFGKGLIFYMKDDIVVGIVLWNVFNRMSVARQVLQDQRKYDDLNEVAKLFNIHEE